MLLRKIQMMNGEVSLVWRGFGDSEIGPLHQRLGLSNQDAYCLKLENQPVLIAVSDGLGSKSLSHLGAQAVTHAVKRLADYSGSETVLEPLSLIKLFHEFWLDELQDVAIEQCRCTAVFAIVWEEQTLFAQLGDGDCCIITSSQYGDEQKARFLTQKNDDLFANQTHSLSQELQINQWHFCLQPTAEIEACFLVTDGIADDIALEHKTNFYFGLLNQYQQLSDEQVDTDVRRWISQWPVNGHSDDKTIVALFRQCL